MASSLFKRDSSIQRSSSTSSRLIIAIWATGPPQARRPKRRKRQKIALSDCLSSEDCIPPSNEGGSECLLRPRKLTLAQRVSRAGAGKQTAPALTVKRLPPDGN